MARYSEAQNKASQRYQKKVYDTTLIRFKKEGDLTLMDVTEAAQSVGESLQQYIITAIKMRIDFERRE